FNEGTELFSKGDLFYSRRIGAQPLHYYSVQESMEAGEQILKNPREAKLINATKISGRTKKGLGVGLFNAVTKNMYAEIENELSEKRYIQTTPLTNYNIIVFDQTLKNNSSISFINTNTFRGGNDYDANVSAALFDMNNKKNSYNWSGKVAVSHLTEVNGVASTGYSHQAGFRKSSGLFLFQLSQELTDDQYNINDMGIQFNNNFLDHYAWLGYRWLKPKGIYNRVQINYNNTYSRRFQPGDYQFYNTNINANMQFKNLWFAGAFIGYNAEGNDFYEPRTAGSVYRTPSSWRYNVWVESNEAKKYFVGSYFFTALPDMFNGRIYEYMVSQRYRFNDRFSISHSIMREPRINDAGFYKKSGNDILFSRRDRLTVENVLGLKYSFNNKSGITFRARHYWSKVNPKELFALQQDGSLQPYNYNGEDIDYNNINFFNIDAVYTLQFAPGSFLHIVWKNSIFTSDEEFSSRYFRNADRTIAAPQNNNLSIKLLYFLDYLDMRKWWR
ncbi:MAG: DUF5916 domain-containing protein, partial [Bacteroidota bacterium]|nr:DUF5916 domain-containing protein [Bacteroidota bacterium]